MTAAEVCRADLAVAIILAARLTDAGAGEAAADAVLALLRERGEYREKFDARWGLLQYRLVELGAEAGEDT